jgi:cytochrome c biogenesis protein
VIVREGSGFSNTLTQYDAWGGGRLTGDTALAPFSFTLTDFRVEFSRDEAQRGSPTLFQAEIAYQDNPQVAPVREVIEVNYPLEADGAKVFLVGHGYAPHFVVRDASGAVLFDDSVPFLPQDGSFTSTGVVKVPDASPQLGFTALFLPTTAVDDIRGPHSTFPEADDPSVFLSAWTGDLGLDGGVPQSIYTLETEGMEQIGLEALVPGQTWEFPQGSIEFTGFERWASFQIAHDPGKEVTLITAVLAMIGLILTLSVRRRRVWVKVDSLPDGRTLVQVAGIAREGGGEATREIAHVGRSLGAPAELIPEEDE